MQTVLAIKFIRRHIKKVKIDASFENSDSHLRVLGLFCLAFNFGLPILDYYLAYKSWSGSSHFLAALHQRSSAFSIQFKVLI
jgi:hypothetical protein